MKKHQKSVGLNDEWLTPRAILDALGSFDLDPCAPVHRPWDTAARHFTIEDNGLVQPWEGRVWCNPPFNRFLRPLWMAKIARHGDGILLVPAAVETKAYFDYVWQSAGAVCFVRGRPHFHYVDGSRSKGNAGTAIALAAYGARNVESLKASGLGKVVSCS